MNIEQVKWDFENGVLIGRETMRKLIDWALMMQADTAKAMASREVGDQVIEALGDMARIRSEHDQKFALHANIDAQMAVVDAGRIKRLDRRLAQTPVEFDRRGTAEDRRANVRRELVRRESEK